MCSREFDHYVKHVSLGKWTKEEVDKVLTGGNKVKDNCELSSIESRQEVPEVLQSQEVPYAHSW